MKLDTAQLIFRGHEGKDLVIFQRVKLTNFGLLPNGDSCPERNGGTRHEGVVVPLPDDLGKECREGVIRNAI